MLHLFEVMSQSATKKSQSFTKKNLDPMIENELSNKIIGCAIEVHKQ